MFINGKMREIFDLHFFANYCVVTKVEVPNVVLTCNIRNKFVIIIISVYQAVKNPATPNEFAVEFSFMLEINNAHPGMEPSS